MHKDNIYNERGAYEENFLIPLLFVPPISGRDPFAIGTAHDHRFSQMDVFPTILELIGMERKLLLGESFAPWLLRSPGRALLRLKRPRSAFSPMEEDSFRPCAIRRNIYLMCSGET